jgi:hypothetical protein
MSVKSSVSSISGMSMSVGFMAGSAMESPVLLLLLWSGIRWSLLHGLLELPVEFGGTRVLKLVEHFPKLPLRGDPVEVRRLIGLPAGAPAAVLPPDGKGRRDGFMDFARPARWEAPAEFHLLSSSRVTLSIIPLNLLGTR